MMSSSIAHAPTATAAVTPATLQALLQHCEYHAAVTRTSIRCVATARQRLFSNVEAVSHTLHKVDQLARELTSRHRVCVRALVQLQCVTAKAFESMKSQVVISASHWLCMARVCGDALVMSSCSSVLVSAALTAWLSMDCAGQPQPELQLTFKGLQALHPMCSLQSYQRIHDCARTLIVSEVRTSLSHVTTNRYVTVFRGCFKLQCSKSVGKFTRTMTLLPGKGFTMGLAISPDAVYMVTSVGNTLSVYSLPNGEHICTFGSGGEGKGQFRWPSKLCFSAVGNILVAEQLGDRVQEVTLTGGHVRFIGIGTFDCMLDGVTANVDVIVVVKHSSRVSNRIVMFDAVTGACVRAFGDYGAAPGQLKYCCNGIRITLDNHHIIVSESDKKAGRLSMFTLAGEFVRCIGVGELAGTHDVDFTDSSDIIACDSSKHRVFVYSADGSTVLRQWGGRGDADGEFKWPTAVAMCGGQLYVLDEGSNRVQVFE